MGKYEVSDQKDINDVEYEKLFFLKAISNELAEANRLKKIELRQKQGLYKKYNIAKFNSLLEDRA